MATPESHPPPSSPLPPASPGQTPGSSNRKSGKARRKLTDEEIVYHVEYLPLKALQINVKNVNPANGSSGINKAIQIDDWRRLEYLIDLGDFTVDRESTTARILGSRAMGGLNVLTNLCIDLSAPGCLLGLYQWAQNPENNYWVNEKQLFNYAKDAALKGNLICCLVLMEQYIIGGEDKTNVVFLANDLYPLAKSSSVAGRLGKFIFGPSKYIFFYPHLVYLCGQPGINPLIVANTLQLAIDMRENVDTFDQRLCRFTKVPLPDDDTKRTAMSEAARVLNITALDVLLQSSRSRQGLDKIVKDHISTAEYNPLYTLLRQDFPFLAPFQSPSSTSDDTLITHPNDQEVYFQLFRTGYAIYEGVKLLKRAIRKSQPDTITRESVLPIISRASDIYAATIRNLIMRKILRHLPPKSQAELIEPYKSSIKTPEQAPISFKYGFRTSINGSQLQETLREWDIPLEEPFIRAWAYLVELETIKQIVDLVVTKIEGAKINSSTNILYEYILDPKSRERIEPPLVVAEAKSSKKDDPWEDKGDGKLRGSWSGIVKFGTEA